MTAKVVVLDYGSGNLRSAQRALERVGASVEVTADTEAALAVRVSRNWGCGLLDMGRLPTRAILPD